MQLTPDCLASPWGVNQFSFASKFMQITLAPDRVIYKLNLFKEKTNLFMFQHCILH